MSLTKSVHSSRDARPSGNGRSWCLSALVQSVSKSQSQRESLPWDTAHFGWATAQLTEPRLSAAALHGQLSQARADGIRLVYWFAAGDCQPDEDLLRQWSGSLVDRKATFRLSLADRTRAATGQGDQTVRISDQSRDDVSPELVALAISAGEFSRFRRDPRIPQAAFRGLYEAWIRRSVAGELADRVFVASRNGSEPSGLVTVHVRDGIGEIGLVSVAQFARGQGIGGLLMNRALDWIDESGASVAMVVTQLDNTAACRLYARLQFELTDVSHVYHFWPAGASEP